MNREIMRAILSGYALPARGTHGVDHWARVRENGERIAEQTGADLEIVQLFSIFHDCRRVNENRDPEHGRRGAEFAATLQGSLIQLEPSRFDLLHYACTHHTGGMTEADPTVQACWDADRLDLGRVWITPEPGKLCTEAARDPKLIAWATKRAKSNYRPAILDEWLDDS